MEDAPDPAPAPATRNPLTALLARPRRPARPWSGLVILLGMAAALVVLVLAAYHGSSQTPPSDCTRAATLLRRTTADATTARQAFSTTGAVPPADGQALRTDGDRLTSMLQSEPESDLAFDEKVLPVTDAITSVVAGTSPAPLVGALATLSSSTAAAGSFCGVGT